MKIKFAVIWSALTATIDCVRLQQQDDPVSQLCQTESGQFDVGMNENSFVQTICSMMDDPAQPQQQKTQGNQKQASKDDSDDDDEKLTLNTVVTTQRENGDSKLHSTEDLGQTEIEGETEQDGCCNNSCNNNCNNCCNNNCNDNCNNCCGNNCCNKEQCVNGLVDRWEGFRKTMIPLMQQRKQALQKQIEMLD